MADKILIADDDDRINELLQEIFTMEGYEMDGMSSLILKRPSM